MGFLVLLMRRRLGGLEGRSLLALTARSGIASLAMGLGLLLWLSLVPPGAVGLVSIGGVVLGGGIYGMAVLALGVPEAKALLQSGRRKLGRGEGLG
jgi:hypothetical protein